MDSSLCELHLYGFSPVCVKRDKLWIFSRICFQGNITSLIKYLLLSFLLDSYELPSRWLASTNITIWTTGTGIWVCTLQIVFCSYIKLPIMGVLNPSLWLSIWNSIIDFRDSTTDRARERYLNRMEKVGSEALSQSINTAHYKYIKQGLHIQ